MPDYNPLLPHNHINRSATAAAAAEQKAVLKMNNDEKKEEEDDFTVVHQNSNSDMMVHKKRRFGSEKTMDPVIDLPLRALVIVFSFAGIGPPKEEEDDEQEEERTNGSKTANAPLPPVCFQEAGRLYAGLALVSCSWKKAADLLLSQGLLNGHALDVNLPKIHTDRVFPCIGWLCQHKVALGSLEFEAYQSDYRLLALLLQECDTQHLTKVIAMTFPYQSHHWVPQDAFTTEHFLQEPLMTDASFQTMLAEQCPNLSDLSIRLSVRGENVGRDFANISPTLFSMDSIVRLKVSFSSPMIYDDIDDYFFSRLIEYLPSLKELILVDQFGGGSPFRSRWLANHDYNEMPFVIQSRSLVTLNVMEYRRQTSFSCKCPNLQKFLCKGILPTNTYGRIVRVYQKLLDDGNAPQVRFVNLKNDAARRSDYRPRSDYRQGVVMSRGEMDAACFVPADHTVW